MRVLAEPNVDKERTTSNDIVEIFACLGNIPLLRSGYLGFNFN